MQNRPGEDGIIGRRVLPKNWVARKPSNIYWNGIRTYSICTQDLTIPELLKASITLQAQKKTSALGNKGDDAADSERDDVDAGREVATQLFSVPDDYYADWRTALSIHLTATEAAFLRKMIENSVSASLLGYLLRHSVDVTKYVDLYLGSMNATYSAVNKNVEMMIRLRTKNRYYNSEMFLRDLFCGKADNPQNPFELSAVAEATADLQQEKANQLEQIIKTVCRLPMMASVTERDGKYDVSLEITGQIPEGDISITPFRRNVLIPPGLRACPIPVCPCSI